MSECIFCKIVAGEIPAALVYEDDLVIAFDDISPQAPVHTLVIPRAHHANLGDGLDAPTLAAVFSAVRRVAEIKGVAAGGYRVIVNNGADAGQLVDHLHVHVLGGKPMAHGMVRFEE
jgi:histidine triad (HIT) family protein